MPEKMQRPAGKAGRGGSHLQVLDSNYRAKPGAKQRPAHAAASCYCLVTGNCVTCAYWVRLIRFVERWKHDTRLMRGAA